MNDANGSTHTTEAHVPLGAPSSKALSTEAWLAQSAIVAAVLGGTVLLVYGWKRMLLTRSGGVPRNGARAARAGALSAGATPSVPGGTDVHARVMALTDAVRVLRDEVARANGDVSVLREELDVLRASLDQGAHDADRADTASQRHRERDEPTRTRRATNEDPRAYAPDARDATPADGRDRVVTLARRGMTPIAIARETGIPTGQVELILNLHRTGGV